MLVAVGVSGCQAASGVTSGPASSPASSAPSASSSTTAPVPVPVSLSVAPSDKTSAVPLDAPITVTASSGRVDTVTVVDDAGEPLAGKLAADGTRWTSSSPLAPRTTYTVSATGSSRTGASGRVSAVLTTAAAAKTSSASLVPGNGWTVGVGMPVEVDFTHKVTNRAAVEKALTVTATPAAKGAWRWISSSRLEWRPESFWKSGSTVKVSGDLSKVELAKGVWGAKDISSGFSVGSAMVSTVDVAKHTLTVTRNGKLLRVIPVTTGKPGFQTRNGIKVIISRQSSVQMDAATTGIDRSSPEYYNLNVKWAMRLTWSGEFLHAAPWSVASQGKANVSHGCTGMSTADAEWLFHQSKVGDVVRFVNSPRPLEPGNGYTMWNMSFAKWSGQSA